MSNVGLRREEIMAKKPTDDVMTIDELANYLKVAKSSLYRLAQNGRMPGKKVGKHWRFHKGLIDRWLADGGDTSAKTRAHRGNA